MKHGTIRMRKVLVTSQHYISCGLFCFLIVWKHWVLRYLKEFELMRNKWFWIWFYPRKLENMIQLQSSGSKKNRGQRILSSREKQTWSFLDVILQMTKSMLEKEKEIFCFAFLISSCSALSCIFCVRQERLLLSRQTGVYGISEKIICLP